MSETAPKEEGATGKHIDGSIVNAEMSAASWRKYLMETNLLITTNATSTRPMGAGTFVHALIPDLPLKGPQPFKSQVDVTEGLSRPRTYAPGIPLGSSLKTCKCHKKKCQTCLNCVERHCVCKRSRAKRAKTSLASSDEEQLKEEDETSLKDGKQTKKNNSKGKKLPPSTVRGCTCHRKKCETCRNCVQRHCKCDGRNPDTSDPGEPDEMENDNTTSNNGEHEEKQKNPRKRKQTCSCRRKKCQKCENCIARHCNCPRPESNGCECSTLKCEQCNHCINVHCLCEMEKSNDMLNNQLLFINALADGKLKLSRRDHKDVIKELRQRGFDPNKDEKDFEYLLSLPISTLLKHEIDTLQEKADESQEILSDAFYARAGNEKSPSVEKESS